MRSAPLKTMGTLLGAVLVGLLLLPLVALALSATWQGLLDGVASPQFAPALWLSLKTTVFSVVFTVVTGTPLAWWLATSHSRMARVVEVVVELPIVIPPAVVGVALLQTFGRQGLVGPGLEALGIFIPFTSLAVVIAQTVVSAPFFVQAAASTFREVDRDLLIVARTLGASPSAAFFRVAVPIALPGLVVGASLAWARALGEFGATLLFAGNMPGVTQTMPLAIFAAMESDVQLAVVFSLVLAALGGLLLLGLKFTPWIWARVAQADPPADGGVR